MSTEVTSSPGPPESVAAAASESAFKAKHFLENTVQWPPVIKKYRLLQSSDPE
jgi:hypothetical protein